MSANKVSLTLKLTIFITSASTHISKALQNAAENTVADVCVCGGGRSRWERQKTNSSISGLYSHPNTISTLLFLQSWQFLLSTNLHIGEGHINRIVTWIILWFAVVLTAILKYISLLVKLLNCFNTMQ